MARQNETIDNETFEADIEMIPLLKELNKVGLHTTQHCIGHKGQGNEKAYLSIEIKPDMDIGIRYDVRPRLIIRWRHSSASHNTGKPSANAHAEDPHVGCA